MKINRAVYPAWKNSKTGNVISIVSDCNESNTLTGLHTLITDSIEQAKLIKQRHALVLQHGRMQDHRIHTLARSKTAVG